MARSAQREEERKAAALRSALGDWLGGEVVRATHVYPGLSAVLLELAPAAPSVRIAEQLAACAGPIRYVELDYTLTLETTAPDDRRWPDQASFRKMAVDAAWEHTTGKQKVVVAVIDSGIDLEHPDLKDNLWLDAAGAPGRSFVSPGEPPLDTDGHGTQVAGIIGARGNNHAQLGDHSCVAGVAWEVSLVALKVTGGAAGPAPSGDRSDDLGLPGVDPLTRAIQYATAIPADVINASVSVPASHLVHDAVAAAPEILVVAAAPRSQPDVDAGVEAPRAPCGIPLDNVICVTATDEEDQLAPGASVGAVSVDLGATAAGVRTTSLRHADPEGCSTAPRTSSIAAPHVAGVAALLRARCPGLPVVEMRKRILDGGDPIELSSTVTGRRLNAAKAVTPGCPIARPGQPVLLD